MTKNEMIDRFDFLTDVIRASRGLGYFTTGERMLLHLERSALLSAQDGLYPNDGARATPWYCIPREMELKCQHVKKDFNL